MDAHPLHDLPWWKPHPQQGRPIPREFFQKPTLWVARHLLGTRLVHRLAGQRIAGIVVETEAYIGEVDQGCHARAGRTPRTQVMYGPPGHAYVYFNYGMHWLFNVVTEREGFPAAVLVRALVPVEGLDAMARRRPGRPFTQWADGPAKLCRALGITGAYHGLDLTASDAPLFFEYDGVLADAVVRRGPRVGLNRVPLLWRMQPWRFRLDPQAYRQALEKVRVEKGQTLPRPATRRDAA